MIRFIDRELKRRTDKTDFLPHVLYGSGGTFTALATMMMAAKGQSGLPIMGYHVAHAEVRHLLDRLRKMSLKERRNVSGLSPDRADIIVAGLAIIDRILHHFDVNLVQVHQRGVRDGLILTMIDQIWGESTAKVVDRDAALEQFAAQCGSDLRHERHVAFLARLLHNELAGPLGLDPSQAYLLEAAARLQDVGYLINYDKHHKHSFHLILNSRLPGFRPHELQLIANIARYHRGSRPKKRHANFRQLSPRDQECVRRLASLLRIAGGLDRSHTQQITSLTANVSDRDVAIQVASATMPEVDLWGARRRTRMFEKVFRRTTTITWLDPASSPRETDSSEEAGANGKPGTSEVIAPLTT
jgi:exopolyphosphatase/guanosine-5'-triphosphate,3'-diphosphate pyrophosphatase